MANSFGSQGLVVATRTELIDSSTAAFQTIYGSQINIGPETPDGQMIMIPIQTALDLEELLLQIYNSFNPDTAVGNALYQRGAINGIQVQAGTFTNTDVRLVLSQSVNLYGLDQTVQPVYTVADVSGNQYQLAETHLGFGPVTADLLFIAATAGAITPTPNTINIPVSIVLGVSSINNPSAALSIGVNQESDAAFRIRRAKSVALPNQGYLNGLYAALANTTGVTFAFIEENNTGSTNADGVPGHSIWVIVAGSASAADIAQTIYVKRNLGCGMFGSQEYSITQADGSIFPIFWDDVTEQPLFLTFQASSLDGVTPPNVPTILGSLASIFTPSVAQQVNINELSTLVQDIDSNTLVTGAGFSTGLTQYVNFSGTAASGSFKLTYGGSSTAFINWNTAVGTIQTDVRTLPGLGSATVIGSIASGSLTIALVGVASPTLLGVTSNNLETGGSAPITLSFLTRGYSNTLNPTTKAQQFATSEPNFIILPVYITGPQVALSVGTSSLVTSALTIAHGGSQTLASVGGYSTMTFTLTTNGSGGSCSSGGAYVAGATPATDVATVTDELGNSGILTITVT